MVQGIIVKRVILVVTMCISLFAQADDEIPTPQQYAEALLNAIGVSGPRLNQMIRAFATYCGTEENFYTGMNGDCDDIYFQALNGNRTTVLKVLRVLRPREIVQSARKSAEIIASQQANISTRMAQIRNGAQNIASQTSMSPGLLAFNSEDSSADLINSPWGFFANGRYSSGDYSYLDTDIQDEGFDFDTRGITMGVDYRLNDKSAAGFAVGYANFESETSEESTIHSKAISYSAYGTFNITDNFYADIKASYSEPEIDQNRTLNFTIGSNVNSTVAHGETQSYQKSVVISSGYQFYTQNGWQFTPSVSFEYNETLVNEFVESGASDWNVAYSKQTYYTMRSVAEMQVAKSISLNRGVIIPSFNFRIIHEKLNTSNNMFMRVDGMPIDEFFETDMNFTDNNYQTAGFTLTYLTSGGKQAYIRYSEIMGWDEINQYNINIGARFEF